MTIKFYIQILLNNLKIDLVLNGTADRQTRKSFFCQHIAGGES